MSPTPLADQAIRNSLRKEWSLRERAEAHALGMTGSDGLQAILRSTDAQEWQKSAARWWTAQGPAISR